MSAQENKAIARRWAEEVWSKGNFGLIEELVAPEYVARDAINPGRYAAPRASGATLGPSAPPSPTCN